MAKNRKGRSKKDRKKRAAEKRAAAGPRLPVELIGHIVGLINFVTPELGFLGVARAIGLKHGHGSFRDMAAFGHLRATTTAVKNYAELSHPSMMTALTSITARRLLDPETFSAEDLAAQGRPLAPLHQRHVKLFLDEYWGRAVRLTEVLALCPHLTVLRVGHQDIDGPMLARVVEVLIDRPLEILAIIVSMETVGWQFVPALAPLVVSGKLQELQVDVFPRRRAGLTMTGLLPPSAFLWSPWSGHAIRTLTIHGVPLYKSDLDAIRLAFLEQGLEALHLDGTLRKLDLSNNPLSASGLIALSLKHNKSITELRLSNVGLRHQSGALDLASNESIRTLDLSDNQLQSPGFDLGETAVESLDLTKNKIRVSTLFLFTNSRLRVLKLRGNRCRVNCGALDLDEITTLQVLDVGCCELNQLGSLVQYLSRNSTLRVLHIDAPFVSDPDRRPATESNLVLPKFLTNNGIVELDLSNSPITDQRLASMCLENLHRLKKINLSLTKVSRECIKRLKASGLEVEPRKAHDHVL